MFDKIINYLRDKWPLIVAWNVCIIVFFYAYGCEPTTRSLIDPREQITRAQLLTELDIMLLQAESRITDLDKQQALRNILLQQSLTLVQTGAIDPLGVITSILAVLGVGATVDDIRLRRQRKNAITYEPIKKDPIT